MAGKSCSGFKAELPWDSRHGKKSLAKQYDARHMGGSYCSCPANIGGVCSHLGGKVGKNEGHIDQVVEASVGGYNAKALSQGGRVGSGFPCIGHKDLPGHGALPQGLSPDHQDVEGQT